MKKSSKRFAEKVASQGPEIPDDGYESPEARKKAEDHRKHMADEQAAKAAKRASAYTNQLQPMVEAFARKLKVVAADARVTIDAAAVSLLVEQELAKA